MSRKAYLLLENGKLFEGMSVGHTDAVMGQLVFTTGMTGYMETLTDPGYIGKIVCQTFPLIGNYGVIPDDLSETPMLSGYIMREWCQQPSNFRSEGGLDAFLLAHKVPGIYGIDTRELTRILRNEGSMAGMLTCDLNLAADTQALKGFSSVVTMGTNSRRSIETFGEGNRVVVWDMGAVDNLVDELIARGFQVVCVPHTATADEIAALQPCGIIISDGAGDPHDCPAIVAEVGRLCDSGVPTLGVGVGHLLVALAHGATVDRMMRGHHGDGQPTANADNGLVYLTRQNHGYVVGDAPPQTVASTLFTNVNDGTCEGLNYRQKPILTVQFRPTTARSPQSTGFVFDRFADMMEVRNAVKK